MPRQGTAGGLVIAAQQLGAGFGIAILVTVLSAASTSDTPAGAVDGYRLAFLAGAAIATGATAVATAWRPADGTTSDAERPTEVRTPG